MAKNTNAILLAMASFLALTLSCSNAQVLVIGTGLTCSSPSPLLNRQVLAGANATLSCDGGLTAVNSTTTEADGDFVIAINNVVSVPNIFPTSCRVFIDVPANCTIRRLSGQVDTLRSLSILRVTGQTGTFRARTFVAYN